MLIEREVIQAAQALIEVLSFTDLNQHEKLLALNAATTVIKGLINNSVD